MKRILFTLVCLFLVNITSAQDYRPWNYKTMEYKTIKMSASISPDQFILLPTFEFGVIDKRFGLNYRVSYGVFGGEYNEFWFQPGFQYRTSQKSTVYVYPVWFKGVIGSNYLTPTSVAFRWYVGKLEVEPMLSYFNNVDNPLTISIRVSTNLYNIPVKDSKGEFYQQ